MGASTTLEAAVPRNDIDLAAVSSKPLSGDELLIGNGEMAMRIRSFDWSLTPVGATEKWPQSLRTAVQIMLCSRYPMFLWWGSAMINFYNDAYAPMLGKRHPSALGRSAYEVWADVWPICGPQAEAVLVEGKSSWNEELLLVVERNGYAEEAYFTFSYSPVIDDQGRPGGVFCAVTEETARVLNRRRLKTLRDLGERAPAESNTDEQACRAAACALAQNPNDFPFALIYLLSEEGHQARLCETVNLAPAGRASPMEVSLGSVDDVWRFSKVLKRNTSEVVGDLEERFGRLPAGPWPDDCAKQAVVLPLGQTGMREFPTGFLVAGLSPRLQFNDDYHGFLHLAAGCIAMAIADARAYQEQRRRAEALAELDRAKTIFFNNVSHEFRTPLTLMLGPLEDILNSGGNALTPEQRELLVVTHRNSLRLLKLVNSLLDFSRIEAGRVQATYEPTDLAAFTTELCGVFRAAIEKAGLRLTVDCPPLGQDVYVDHNMWEEIVLNLLSNAFKFTLQGEIGVWMRLQDGFAELVVRDTGSGIPEKEVSNIFKRFHRIEGAPGRTFEGSGIGLALVQELTKLHGGLIAVTSALGKGTEFKVAIPLGTAHLAKDRVKPERNPATRTANAAGFIEEALRWLPNMDQYGATRPAANKAGIDDEKPAVSFATDGTGVKQSRVLVADDNADMREYLQRILSPCFEVIPVADGQAALSVACERKPDLILSDVMMPRLDGLGLLQAIRSHPDLRTIPVILLSARAGEEPRVEGLQTGADDYLIKPFSGRELVARVESHLRMARLRQEAFDLRRRLEDSVEEQNRKFRDVIERINDGFLALDAEWRFTYVNKTAEQTIGRRAGEVIGKNHWEEYPDTVGTRLELEFRRAMAQQVPVEFENFYEPWQRWFEVRAYPSPQGLGVYFRDITERKHNERQQAALYELVATINRSSLISEVFDYALEAVCQCQKARRAAILLTDSDRIMRFKAWRGLSEPYRKEVEGHSPWRQDDSDPQPVLIEDIGSATLDDSLRAVLVREGIHSLAFIPLTSGKMLLGKFMIYYDAPHPFRRDEIRPAQIIARQLVFALERQRNGEALERLVNERTASLQAAIAQMEEFSYSVSHDLRSPVRAMQGYAKALAEDHSDKLDQQARDYVNRIIQGSSRMERLIHDVLTFSRVSRLHMKLQPVSLDALLLDLLKQFPELDSVRADIIVPMPLPVVLGHEPLLGQALSNLLRNAVKFVAPGVRPQVRISYERCSDSLVLRIKDNGIGIMPEHQSRLFAMFERIHPGSDYEGTGIGLAIVRKAIERMGGKVGVESDGIHGSTFWLQLTAV